MNGTCYPRAISRFSADRALCFCALKSSQIDPSLGKRVSGSAIFHYSLSSRLFPSTSSERQKWFLDHLHGLFSHQMPFSQAWQSVARSMEFLMYISSWKNTERDGVIFQATLVEEGDDSTERTLGYVVHYTAKHSEILNLFPVSLDPSFMIKPIVAFACSIFRSDSHYPFRRIYFALYNDLKCIAQFQSGKQVQYIAHLLYSKKAIELLQRVDCLSLFCMKLPTLITSYSLPRSPSRSLKTKEWGLFGNRQAAENTSPTILKLLAPSRTADRKESATSLFPKTGSC